MKEYQGRLHRGTEKYVIARTLSEVEGTVAIRSLAAQWAAYAGRDSLQFANGKL